MIIGVLGIGMIGEAIKSSFELYYDVVYFDPKYKKTRFENILNSQIVFICVPTDQNKDGSCDVSIVDESLEKLNDQKYSGVIVIKSTVYAGYTKSRQTLFPNLNISFVPEFLRERCAFDDFMNTETLIIGTDNDDTFDFIRNAHGFLKAKKIIKVSTSEAEIIKYKSNVYKAMKVVFSNIIYELTQKLNGDYNDVLSSFLSLNIKESDYMTVNDDFRGYGGYCLPKDTNALNYTLKKLGLNFKLIESIDSDNKKFKQTVPKGMRL